MYQRLGQLLIGVGLICGLGGQQDAHSQSAPPLATMGLIAPSAPEPAVSAPLPDIRIRINIPATTLTVYKDNQVAKVFRVSVGMMAHQSPVMESSFHQLIWNPSWIPPPDSPWAAGLKPEPPGPRNPLGPVKMLLDSGIRIHGTNKDTSVGHPSSHGCFRMHNKDAADLAWFLQQNLSDKTDESYRTTYAKNRSRTYVVALGAPVPVEVVYEPVEVIGDLLTVHPDLYGRNGPLKHRVLTALSTYGITEADVHPVAWQEIQLGIKKGSITIPLEELKNPSLELRHLGKG